MRRRSSRPGWMLHSFLLGLVVVLVLASPAGAVVASTPAVAQGAVYAYDVPARLSSPNAAATYERSSPSWPGAAEVSPVSVRDGSVATNTADEFIDLASASRRNHILYGDATGGGHLWPGLSGKTPFPKDWSADRVMHEISDVATDPNSIFTPGRGGSTIVTGTRDSVDIKVILRDGDIITGYPTNLLRNS